MNDMKSRTAGLGRIFRAMRYSIQGLRAAWQHEAAFRQELCFFGAMAPVTLYLGLPLLHTVLLLAMMGAVLVVELLNSAIEAVVDKTSPEKHPLAGRAKDCASAAVFVAMGVFLLMWAALAGPSVLKLSLA